MSPHEYTRRASRNNVAETTRSWWSVRGRRGGGRSGVENVIIILYCVVRFAETYAPANSRKTPVATLSSSVRRAEFCSSTAAASSAIPSPPPQPPHRPGSSKDVSAVREVFGGESESGGLFCSRPCLSVAKDLTLVAVRTDYVYNIYIHIYQYTPPSISVCAGGDEKSRGGGGLRCRGDRSRLRCETWSRPRPRILSRAELDDAYLSRERSRKCFHPPPQIYGRTGDRRKIGFSFRPRSPRSIHILNDGIAATTRIQCGSPALSFFNNTSQKLL